MRVLGGIFNWHIVSRYNYVFHRILDFKTGLDFYPGPFLF